MFKAEFVTLASLKVPSGTSVPSRHLKAPFFSNFAGRLFCA